MPQSKPKNIGLFGGAFDPVHVGHQKVALAMLLEERVDEVWFVPVFIHPWAKKLGKSTLSPYQDRVEMLKLTAKHATEQHPKYKDRLRVEEYKDVSYTYDTLEYFSQIYPQHTFSWIMGSEYLSRFSDFLELHPRLVEYSFYIYPRLDFPFLPLYENMIALTEVEKVQVSSTQIRKSVGVGEPISTLVVPEVEAYIKKQQLYRL